jgi:hypothetical protein
MDLGKLAEFLNKEREYLLSFRLKPEDLNLETGEKIKKFLQLLEDKKIKYFLSRPLPRCLGIEPKNDEPKNCYECRELFIVNNQGDILLCPNIYKIKLSKKEIKEIPNRKQIYSYLIQKNLQLSLKNVKNVYGF